MNGPTRYLTRFGELIQNLLESKSQQLGRKVTLNELCFRADVDVSNVWRSMYTERREGRPPSPQILRDLSSHLPISYCELLEASGHADLAEVIAEQGKLETRIQADATLPPDLKAQLNSYLQFLRKNTGKEQQPKFA